MEETTLIMYIIAGFFLGLIIVIALSKKKKKYDNGYNELGFDINGKNKKYYRDWYKKINKEKNIARKEIHYDVGAALFHYRKIFEHLLKIISSHCISGECESSGYEVLKKISAEKILDKSFVNNLHRVRKFYNENTHELNDKIDYENKKFMIRTTNKLYSETKKILDI